MVSTEKVAAARRESDLHDEVLMWRLHMKRERTNEEGETI